MADESGPNTRLQRPTGLSFWTILGQCLAVAIPWSEAMWAAMKSIMFSMGMVTAGSLAERPWSATPVVKQPPGLQQPSGAQMAVLAALVVEGAAPETKKQYMSINLIYIL